METVGQAFRYYSFGLIINVAAYAAFVILVTIGMGVKTGFTIVFIIATSVSFMANRHYVFKANNDVSAGYAMHWLNAGAAYVVNLSILWFFVDQLHFTVAYVQLAATIITSSLLFISNKIFVHKRSD